jgi:transcriptional regulator with XRE-family HTH domain
MTRPRVLNVDAARFGAVVNRLRLERGWSLVDLSKVTGMNAIYLGVLERGENVPSLTTILRLAEALGVSAALLVHEVALARHAARAKTAAHSAVAEGTETDGFGRGTD